jgi:hypothetical protein
VAIACVCVYAVLAPGTEATTDARTPNTVPPPDPNGVQLALTGGHLAVPKFFFGLSVEANELPTYEASPRLFDRFLAMVRPRDGSKMLLRIGGKSTDDAYWKVTPPPGTPHWVFELGDPWLSQLAALVRSQDLRVMLDVNLAVHSPAMAADFGHDVARSLPGGRLFALGIGNEPDLYHLQPRLQQERITSTLASTPPDWATTYSPSAYQDDYRAYAQALLSSNPHTPLVGPDTTSSTPSWIAALSSLTKAGPSLITMHRYAYSSCYKPGSPFYPTVPRLLKQSASGGLATRLRKALQIATDSGMGLRVTELNSISCGGQAGVADTFATALWAPDALFELMKAGIAGVNWHIRPTLHNAPFHLLSSGFEAMPELYGLALFNQMIGKGSQLELLQQVNPAHRNLKAWAVRTGKTLQLLLINKDARADTVQLDAAPLTTTPARISRLAARSLGAQSGVSLGGRVIGPDARWHGSRVTSTVRPAAGFYRFTVKPYSAELIRLAYR